MKESGFPPLEKIKNPEDRVLEEFDIWANNFLEQAYQDPSMLEEEPEPQPGSMAWNVLDQAYEQHTGSIYDDVHSGERFRFEGILKARFFRTLHKFAIDKYKDIGQKGQLDAMLLGIQQNCFNHSSVTDGIPAFEKVLLLLEFLRGIPTAQCY